jgi:hypothetical protein
MASKRHCPFKDKNWGCSPQCEWYEEKYDKCAVLNLVDRIDSFLLVLHEFMANQIKIEKAKLGLKDDGE